MGWWRRFREVAVGFVDFVAAHGGDSIGTGGRKNAADSAQE
jgi:hypothetical protein